jgi:hypothetical protein
MRPLAGGMPSTSTRRPSRRSAHAPPSYSVAALVETAVAPTENSTVGQQVGLAVCLQSSYAGLEADLMAAAEQMPDADYGFKPTTMPEVRSYGQLFALVAAGQFGMCARISGRPDPTAGRNLEEELQTKASIVEALADSFVFCDGVVAAFSDDAATTFVRQGQGEVARSAVMAGLVGHNTEMYGISTVYLRAKNLVPPSTARQMERRAAANSAPVRQATRGARSTCLFRQPILTTLTRRAS